MSPKQNYNKLHCSQRLIGALASVLLLCFLPCAGPAYASEVIAINNPYDGVNWDGDFRFKANFHTHTTNSDGKLKPHEAVDSYKALGYSVLAITDHDKVTYPWTAFSKIPPFADKKNTVEERTGYEDRDPIKLGMTSIQGNELSRTHHMVNLWTDSQGGTKDQFPEAQILDSKSKGGQVIFAHPGRYGWNVYEKNKKDKSDKDKKKGADEEGHKVKDEQDENFPFPNPWLKEPFGWPIEKYVYHFRKYEHFIGLEVYNQGDRYPQDRKLWDELLKQLMPDRPVWGFSNDDMHTLEQLGRNQSIVLVEKPTEELIKAALAKGRFYFVYCPKAREGSKPPMVRQISVDSKKLAISVQVDEAKKYEWISDGKVVGTEPTLELAKVNELGNYVRLMIYGTKDDSVIGTQPFGIVRKK